jgi:hypothetical protein
VFFRYCFVIYSFSYRKIIGFRGTLKRLRSLGANRVVKRREGKKFNRTYPIILFSVWKEKCFGPISDGFVNFTWVFLIYFEAASTKNSFCVGETKSLPPLVIGVIKF